MSLDARNLRYTATPGSPPILDGLDLTLSPGSLTLLSGESGSGKSTLIRALTGLLTPKHGLEGTITLDGHALAQATAPDRAKLTGLVLQRPSDQILTPTLYDEVAFAALRTGLTRQALTPHVKACLTRVGLTLDPSHATRALSGGQQQRLAIAAALSGRARYLLLDEPLAWLDPQGALDLLGLLRDLADAGTGVLIAEHRLDMAIARADTHVTIARGKLGPPSPAHPRSISASRPLSPTLLCKIDGLSPAPGRAPGLQGLPLSVYVGERVAILGPNGSGKSTLLAALASDRAARRASRIVALPQDPDLALFHARVRDEVSGNLALLADLKLDHLRDAPPQALSRGERMRVALAAAISARPDLLLLDEPTAGQDAALVPTILAALDQHLPRCAIWFATHDPWLARGWATRGIVIGEGGTLRVDGSPDAAIEALPAAWRLL